MKNKLLILSLGLSMITQMIYSQVPSYVPTNGLAGYWGFNGNANDQSGNSNNGTVNGATLTTDRFGNSDNAYYFDGNNFTRISVQDAPNLNLTNDFTISSWIKGASFESSTTTVRMIISKSGDNVGNPNGFNYGVWGDESLTNNQTGSVNFQAQPFYNTSTIPIGSSGLIQINNWYNFVVTYTKSNSTLKYYINNVLIDTKILAFNIGVNANELWIGSQASIYNTIKTFKGSIDDIGIWNRALSQQEITAMYNGVNYSDTCNAVSGSLVNGLVGYWPFCGNANDQSGNGNNGLVNGATLSTDRFGNSNGAYSFNGVNNSIIIPDSSVLRPSNITISCWINPVSISNGFILSKSSTSNAGSEQYLLNVDGYGTGTASFEVKRNSGCVAGQNWQKLITGQNLINLNVWQNIICTYDGTFMKYYLNGVLIQTYTPISGSIDNCTGGSLNIGRFWNDINGFFNGKIDDIGIWNRALTQQEIAQLYNQNQCITNISVTDTLIINVGQLSYSNPITYANNITIYPNPASTQVNISFNNITNLTGGNINIINSLGQKVATTPITLSGTNTTMSLNSWGGTGLYFVQILNAQGQILDIKKIILQ